MCLKLMYITNDDNIAMIAENSGVDWIFIDLEINGKEERQGHLDSVISRHSLEDVKKIKNVLTKSKLLVRVNPIYEKSEYEIDEVIKGGADIVMLPFFKTKEETEAFIDLVDSRAQICLLLETPEAVENLDEILKLEGIDYILIGLNDLHLGYRMKFMFEPLANGMVDDICRKIKERNIVFGFGGIARLGFGTLPSEYIIAEHYRIGSSMAILSRSFYRAELKEDLEEVKKTFDVGIKEIRSLESELMRKDDMYFQANHAKVVEMVKNIVESM